MAAAAPTYDLVLMLDAQADAQAHERIVGEAREVIAGGGELLHDDAWGERALTYPIEHKATARYHLLQFQTPEVELLGRLDRALRFADEVVRFRIVKLKPGTPDPPRVPAAAAAPAGAATEPPPAAAVSAETAPAPSAETAPAPSAETAPAPSVPAPAAAGEPEPAGTTAGEPAPPQPA